MVGFISIRMTDIRAVKRVSALERSVAIGMVDSVLNDIVRQGNAIYGHKCAVVDLVSALVAEAVVMASVGSRSRFALDDRLHCFVPQR